MWFAVLICSAYVLLCICSFLGTGIKSRSAVVCGLAVTQTGPRRACAGPTQMHSRLIPAGPFVVGAVTLHAFRLSVCTCSETVTKHSHRYSWPLFGSCLEVELARGGVTVHTVTLWFSSRFGHHDSVRVWFNRGGKRQQKPPNV